MHSSDYVITCNFGGWFNILSLCQLFIYTKHIHTISTYTVLAVSIAIWNCSIVSCSCMNLIHSLAPQRLEWKCRISVCFIEFRLENCLIIKKKWKLTFLVVVCCAILSFRSWYGLSEFGITWWWRIADNGPGQWQTRDAY